MVSWQYSSGGPSLGNAIHAASPSWSHDASVDANDAEHLRIRALARERGDVPRTRAGQVLSNPGERRR